MLKKLKFVVTVFLLAMSIIPLVLFSGTFLMTVTNYFLQNDEKNITEVLNRSKKYLDIFVDMNIKDMKVLSNSDDIKSQDKFEMTGLFYRFLYVKDDYTKVKYIGKNGESIEVKRLYETIKSNVTLSEKEKFLMDKGEFCTLINEDETKYIVFSSKVNSTNREGIVLGYIELDKFGFLFKELNLKGIGNIIIKDANNNYIYKLKEEEFKGENLLKEEIKNTDFTIQAYLNTASLRNTFLQDMFKNVVLYFFLTIIMAIVFAYIISESVNRYINKIIVSVNTLTRIKSSEGLIDRISEVEEFKNKFNSIVESINKDKTELFDKAHIDPLTDIYNKRFLIEHLQEKLSRSTEQTFFLMIDIDRFKVINDTYGHMIGDKILSSLAKILKNNIRENDYAIRFGGEEFLLVISNVSKQKVMSIAERIRKQVEEFVFVDEKLKINFTISIGVTQYKENIDYTIDLSDEALYIAKNTGRNKVVYKEA